MKTFRAIRHVVLAALTFAAAHPAWADGLIRDGLGAISVGRGGTNLGFSDNGAIINDNPAAMSNVAGNGLIDLDADTVISAVHYTDADPNNVTSKIRPLPLPEVAYIRKSDDGIWAWGIGAFAPAGFGASYQMNFPLLGNPNQLYRSMGGLGKILPSLSVKLTDKLSVGGTVGVGLSYIEFNSPYFVQTGPFAGAPTLIDAHGLGVAPVGSFGAQYLLSKDTVLGFCWQSSSSFNTRGDATVDLIPFGLTSNFDSKLHIVWPASVAFGVRHNLNPRNIISAEVLWYDWSHSFSNLGVNLSNPSNPAVAGLAPTLSDHLPLNWLNSTSLRTGYQWQPNGRDIYRAGYVYHGSPSPNSTLNPLTDGVLTHTFSLGYSRKLPRCYLNAAYQYSFSHIRHVGTSSIIGGDFDNSTMRAQAHFACLGITVPF